MSGISYKALSQDDFEKNPVLEFQLGEEIQIPIYDEDNALVIAIKKETIWKTCYYINFPKPYNSTEIKMIYKQYGLPPSSGDNVFWEDDLQILQMYCLNEPNLFRRRAVQHFKQELVL